MTLQSAGRRPASDAVERRIAALAPWFHDIVLPSGHHTAADHPLGDFPRSKWRAVAPHLPEDLRGWRVLDVGCNAGFYSFQLAARGADVLGIDHDEHYLRQARWVADQLGAPVRFERRDVYDLADMDEAFDLVMFMGVLYHLRHPLLALDLVASRTRRLLAFQTLTMPGDDVEEPPANLGLDDRDRMLTEGWPKMAFIERSVEDDPTNWWAPNHAAVEAMLRSCGMRVLAHPAHEIYVAAPHGPLPERVRAELGAATRRPTRA